MDKEYLIPLTVLPRFEYQKEPKMYLAFTEVNYLDKADEFRDLVMKYLRNLNVRSLFIPPPDLTLKVGSLRYNDGGEVKRDYEKPMRSFESGFLYQQFNPKPLGTREVWLPDKSTKINNNFWMIIGRQILTSDPTYPDSDPNVTYQRIKDRLFHPFGSFDMPGFGFQYPREWLFIVAEEIANLFPNPDIFECLDIFKRLFKKPKVQLEDGSFVYPPRGVGLGYYEDLKTIGINAILSEFAPISVYGDQGILSRHTVIPAVRKLNKFGFVLPPSKVTFDQTEIKWSGWSMSHSELKRPKLYFEPLVSIFTQQFHWERKQILNSFKEEFPDLYRKWWNILPFQYEIFFGFEYTKGDSLWNFDNGGVSDVSLRAEGHLKGWAAQRLKTPKDTIDDGFLYETPFFTEWKRGDAKAFSILRKKVYRSSVPSNTMIFDFAHPRIVMNKTRIPTLPRLAALVSDSQESKLVVNHQMTTGKFLYGLSGNGATKALSLCNRARNPWEAYATGGYRVITPWRGEPRPSSESVFLLEHFLTQVSQMSSFITTRLDVHSFNYAQLFPHSRPTKRDAEKDVPRNFAEGTDNSKRQKVSYERVSMALMNAQVDDTLVKEDTIILKSVKDLLGDISSRALNLVDVDSLSYEGGDEDLFLSKSPSLEGNDSEEDN